MSVIGRLHRRLPLDLVKFCGSRVLTVNNGRFNLQTRPLVVDLLVRFHCSNNWEQSILEGVPTRKVEWSVC